MIPVKKYDQICLFGYSPHFLELTKASIEAGANVFLIYGERQAIDVKSLGLSDSLIPHLCIASLDSKAYTQLNVGSNASLGISFGSPFIFSSSDIDDFKGNLINSHGSPLPEFKGGGGFSWRILMNDKRGACLMHYVIERIDEGSEVFRCDFEFSHHERKPIDYQRRQLEEEKATLVPWLLRIIKGDAFLSPKIIVDNSDKSTYFPRLSTKVHGFLNWQMSVDDVLRQILAFSDPYSGVITYINGQEVFIKDACIVKSGYWHPFTFGLVIHKHLDSLMVSCMGGVLKISIKDIVHKSDLSISLGDRFWTPRRKLEAAIRRRIKFSPIGQTVVK